MCSLRRQKPLPDHDSQALPATRRALQPARTEPTQTLALGFGAAWIACKEEGRLVRLVPPRRGRSIRLGGGEVIAVVAGLGAIWTLDGDGTVTRIDPSTQRIGPRITLGAARPYNLWVGAGSLWSVDDATGEVLRIDVSRRKVTARIPVGDGPSDIVFAGTSAWIVNHRDRRLTRLETRTGNATTLATLPGDAPERLAALDGSLWITGRGTDLLRVDPQTGGVLAVVEVGASGIDVAAGGGALWVPVRNVAGDRRGFPTMSALKRVSPGGAVTTRATAKGRIDVHGLAADRAGIWLADNTRGRLYRLRP